MASDGYANSGGMVVVVAAGSSSVLHLLLLLAVVVPMVGCRRGGMPLGLFRLVVQVVCLAGCWIDAGSPATVGEGKGVMYGRLIKWKGEEAEGREGGREICFGREKWHGEKMRKEIDGRLDGCMDGCE